MSYALHNGISELVIRQVLISGEFIDLALCLRNVHKLPLKTHFKRNWQNDYQYVHDEALYIS